MGKALLAYTLLLVVAGFQANAAGLPSLWLGLLAWAGLGLTVRAWGPSPAGSSVGGLAFAYLTGAIASTLEQLLSHALGSRGTTLWSFPAEVCREGAVVFGLLAAVCLLGRTTPRRLGPVGLALVLGVGFGALWLIGLPRREAEQLVWPATLAVVGLAWHAYRREPALLHVCGDRGWFGGVVLFTDLFFAPFSPLAGVSTAPMPGSPVQRRLALGLLGLAGLGLLAVAGYRAHDRARQPAVTTIYQQAVQAVAVARDGEVWLLTGDHVSSLAGKTLPFRCEGQPGCLLLEPDGSVLTGGAAGVQRDGVAIAHPRGTVHGLARDGRGTLYVLAREPGSFEVLYRLSPAGKLTPVMGGPACFGGVGNLVAGPRGFVMALAERGRALYEVRPDGRWRRLPLDGSAGNGDMKLQDGKVNGVQPEVLMRSVEGSLLMTHVAFDRAWRMFAVNNGELYTISPTGQPTLLNRQVPQEDNGPALPDGLLAAAPFAPIRGLAGEADGGLLVASTGLQRVSWGAAGLDLAPWPRRGDPPGWSAWSNPILPQFEPPKPRPRAFMPAARKGKRFPLFGEVALGEPARDAEALFRQRGFTVTGRDRNNDMEHLEGRFLGLPALLSVGIYDGVLDATYDPHIMREDALNLTLRMAPAGLYPRWMTLYKQLKALYGPGEARMVGDAAAVARGEGALEASWHLPDRQVPTDLMLRTLYVVKPAGQTCVELAMRVARTPSAAARRAPSP